MDIDKVNEIKARLAIIAGLKPGDHLPAEFHEMNNWGVALSKLAADAVEALEWLQQERKHR